MLGRSAGARPAVGNAVAVLEAERARRVLGQGVAVALAVRGAHEGGDDLEVPLVDLAGLPPEVGEPEVDVELEQLDAGRALCHAEKRRKPVGRHLRWFATWPRAFPDSCAAARAAQWLASAAWRDPLRPGPGALAASPEEAVAILLERGYTACEIDFEGGFWMDYPWAERFGELAREARNRALGARAARRRSWATSDRGKKFKMALGMLDHSAGIAVACGAELVVFHPGFLLGREREQALDDVVEQLGELRERLEGKGRPCRSGSR